MSCVPNSKPHPQQVEKRPWEAFPQLVLCRSGKGWGTPGTLPAVPCSDSPAALAPHFLGARPSGKLHAGTVRLSSEGFGSLRTPLLTARPEGARGDLCTTLSCHDRGHYGAKPTHLKRAVSQCRDSLALQLFGARIRLSSLASHGGSGSGSLLKLRIPVGAESPGPSPQLLCLQQCSEGTRSIPTVLNTQPLARSLQPQQELGEHLLGRTAPRPLHRRSLATGWVHLRFWQGMQVNNPALAPQTPAAAPCSDSSADHSLPPVPVPNRRQHAHIIFKIKLYSFSNKNIESAHQCTSSHLKTAEHIGHKVSRGKGDDPSHQGRSRRGR